MQRVVGCQIIVTVLYILGIGEVLFYDLYTSLLLNHKRNIIPLIHTALWLSLQICLKGSIYETWASLVRTI